MFRPLKTAASWLLIIAMCITMMRPCYAEEEETYELPQDIGYQPVPVRLELDPSGLPPEMYMEWKANKIRGQEAPRMGMRSLMS